MAEGLASAPAAPRLTLAAAADRLTGSWNAKGAPLPVALARVAAPGDDGPCASDAFLAPRVRKAVVKRRPAHLQALAYTRLDYDVGPAFPGVSLSSFALGDARPGDRAITAAVALDPDRKDDPADYRSCMQGSLALSGSDGDLSLTRSPDFANAEFVSVGDRYDYFCGGAHPEGGTSHMLFDRRGGRKIVLTDWFSRAGFVRAGSGATAAATIAPALRKAVLARIAVEDGECRSVLEDTDYWDLALRREGIAFTPSLPHAVQACGDTATLSWAALGPWLNAAGRAGMARAR